MQQVTSSSGGDVAGSPRSGIPVNTTQPAERKPIDSPRGPLIVPIHPPRPVALRLSVIIPTFNESRNIVELVRQLAEQLDPLLRDDYELVVVDDDSPDRTWEIAAAMIATYRTLTVVHRRGERGLSTAVIRGWQVARGNVLAVIDGDLQHPPEVLTRLWTAIERADLAVASRNIEGGGVSDWSVARRVLSRGAQLMGLLVLPRIVARLSDPMSGYFMVRRSAVGGILLDPLGYKILVEVVGRGRIQSIAEVPYVFRERTEGESKVTWQTYVDYVRHLWRLQRPARRSIPD